DYLRLELPGYLPPPPAKVTAYPGNHANLVCWPVQPGATSYNILRSTTSGSGYVAITNGVIGPVCGSGFNNGTWLDTSAANGTTYYYIVQSANPVGATNSPASAGATPSAAISSSAPAAPTAVTIGGVAHHSVMVNWTASAGANFYTVCRSTLFNNGGGTTNILRTIVLNNTNTTTSFTDTAVTDGSRYGYSVIATSAGGASANSATAVAVPLPAPPASAPGSLTGIFDSSSIILDWSAVPDAVGYIISRSTNSAGPYLYVQNITETTFTDAGLNPAYTYYYQVTAVNAAGVSSPAPVTVVPPPNAPISLSAFPGDTQVVLSWTDVPGVTGYYLFSGTSSGNETNLVAANIAGTIYTNGGLVNGTTYYYVVAATNSNGLGPNSPEADATPAANIVITPRTLAWKGDGAANIWDVDGFANCQTNGVRTKFNNGDTLVFDNTGSNNVPVVIAGLPQPALVTFSATKAYTLNGPGSIAGTNPCVKTGSGSLTINNTNLNSGGFVISNGTMYPGNIAANSTAWGTGPITLAGGTIQFNGYGSRDSGSGWGGCTNTINVPAGRTGTLLLPARFGYGSPFNSPLVGAGTLNVTVEYVRDYFTGDWSAFTGLINVSAPAGGAYYSSGDFRINNTRGYANAAIYLNNSVNLYNINANNQTIDLGELGGSSTAYIGGGSLNPTWRIGARNTTNTFAGVIADSGVTSLIKTGTGTLVLTGGNTYSGGTTVDDGILTAGNTVGSATGSGAVNVNSGGALAGNGIIAGDVTVNPGGALVPGNPFGTLTLSNTLTLATGSTTYLQIQRSPHTNDAVAIVGALNEGGTLNVQNIGGAFVNGDSFALFNAGNYSGRFDGFILPSLTGSLVWNTNKLVTAGVLTVVTLSTPTINGVQMTGSNLTISGSNGVDSWPYEVLTATNLALPASEWVPAATNQFDSSGNFSLTLTNAVNPNSPQMFYRL
ncbi:MAG TPA: autotransporter-associated beta strand repeat-containing protein, partial [Verrucomicrobiae bacterium]|nr:autotransporter-associated beta strand repeat-containing protein [Verrucomicrobiae bacterium]